MNSFKHFYIACIFTVFTSIVLSQTCAFHKETYPFLHCEENGIHYEGRSQEMFLDFAKKIHNYRTHDVSERLHILHFGDSHIQADYLPDRIRKRMCNEWGNQAARGVIFPYTVANTNNPHSYSVGYSGEWENQRGAISNDFPNYGIAGMSVSTSDPLAMLSITQPKEGYATSAFTKIRVFHTSGPNVPKILLVQDNNVLWKTSNEHHGYTLFLLKEPMDSLTFVFDFDRCEMCEITLYGISLENENAGITYSSLGANGATVKTLLKSELLEKQLLVLNPSLFILSYGTNDAYRNFDPVEFETNYNALLRRIRTEFPNTPILLTTPGDALRNGGNYVDELPRLNEIIYQVAKTNDCAVWDFYATMGGKGSIHEWFRASLTNQDKLHLIRKGYELQADLLFEALFLYPNENRACESNKVK